MNILHGCSNDTTPVYAVVYAKVGQFIKDLQVAEPGGPKKKYAAFAVPELPESPTAGGIRPACINAMAKKMPIEFVKHTTGHSESGHVADYLDASVVLALPGAIVLAGYNAFPWGELGDGPMAATLDELSGCTPSVSIADLDPVMNKLFNLDSASGPFLYPSFSLQKRIGRLRPMVERCLATLLMYWPERVQAEEMQGVNLKLIDVLMERREVSPWAGYNRVNIEGLVRQWADVIRTNFETVNVHLLMPRLQATRGIVCGSGDNTALQHISSLITKQHRLTMSNLHDMRVQMALFEKTLAALQLEKELKAIKEALAACRLTSTSSMPATPAGRTGAETASPARTTGAASASPTRTTGAAYTGVVLLLHPCSIFIAYTTAYTGVVLLLHPCSMFIAYGYVPEGYMGVVLIYTHVYNTQYSRVVICYTHVARGGGGR